MERQFCINWPAIVEEAKQRRKAQRLTQLQLAKIAGVSTPTISRFESGEKDIQLSSIMSILSVLGMNDQRNLIFPEQNAYYDYDRRLVDFTGCDGNKVIQCAITSEALEEHFELHGKSLMKVFQTNHEIIEHAARRKYLAEDSGAGELILLKIDDIGLS